MNISFDRALDHIEHILENGGSTRSLTDGMPLKPPGVDGRYGTGVANTEMRLPTGMNRATVAWIYREWLQIITNEWSHATAKLYAGAWVDNGFVYFDLSRSFENLQDAIDYAKLAKQLAIWDDVQECVAWDSRWSNQIDSDVCYCDSDGNKVC